MDVVTLIFVLSAVHPEKMKLALENINKVVAKRKEWKASFSCCFRNEMFQVMFKNKN